MSDINPQGPPMDTGTSGEGQVQVPDSLADDFLKGIPEADRNVVEQYVKAWDQGVTKKFEEIHGTYKGYKDLGSVDDIKAWQNVAKMLSDDPKGFVSAVAEELGLTVAEANQLQQQLNEQQNSPVGSPAVPEAYKGLPEDFVKEFKQLKDLVPQIAQTLISQDAAKKEADQQTALDAHLKELKSKHGEFDDEYVMFNIHKGLSAEDAIKKYQAIAGASKPAIPTPPPLGGGGFDARPAAIKDMTPSQTTSLVADIMKRHAEAQG